MNIRDLENAARFLRRMTVGQSDEERLIRTVAALEAEIKRRREEKQHRG